jgi:TonB family protein
MINLWKCTALIVLFSSFASAQSANSTTDNQATTTPGSVSTSSTAAIPQPALADSKGLEIIHAQMADYPLAAERGGIQGEVMVKVIFSETGDVEKMEVLSGDPSLVDAAVRAAKKFKIKPFIRNGKPVKVATKLPFDFYFRDKVVPGTSIGADAPKRVKVSAGVTTGLLIRKIQPVYPLEAKHNRIQGSVVLSAIIGKDGRIQDLKATSGPKELIAASIGAVQQWVYRPYLLLGEPVEVDTQITVNFTLSPF